MVFVRRNVKLRMSMKMMKKENVKIVTNPVLNVTVERPIVVLNVTKIHIYTKKHVSNLAQMVIMVITMIEHVKNVIDVKHVMVQNILNVVLVMLHTIYTKVNVLNLAQVDIMKQLKRMATEFVNNVIQHVPLVQEELSMIVTVVKNQDSYMLTEIKENVLNHVQKDIMVMHLIENVKNVLKLVVKLVLQLKNHVLNVNLHHITYTKEFV